MCSCEGKTVFSYIKDYLCNLFCFVLFVADAWVWQMKQTMMKIRSLIEDENLEEASLILNELESLHDDEEECITQLETEQMLLLNKISQLGQEIINSSPRRSSSD